MKAVMVFAYSSEAGSFNRDPKYSFPVEAFNENGVSGIYKTYTIKYGYETF